MAGIASFGTREYSPWDLLVARTGNNNIGVGAILDPDWIDIQIPKYWKNKCLFDHASACHNPLRVPQTRPAWLIDVENKCLVSGQGSSGNFVALSYRWSKDYIFQAKSENLEDLQRRYSLEIPAFAERLSPIIQHSIYFTRAIGERYLWVDAVCIIHGNVAETKEQLGHMGSIYASAIFTIIAADGDSKYGLPGLKNISSSRNLEQIIIPFGKEKFIVRKWSRSWQAGSWPPDALPYYKRGWTYQEQLMSSRKLIFQRNMLHWECACRTWHEELTLGTKGTKIYDYENELRRLLAGFPDMNTLTTLISEYNNRQLSREEDAWPGIVGLLSTLGRAFPDGFLYGLPQMVFDRALGWKPKNKYSSLKRRTSSTQPAEAQLPDSTLPSWSWIGWQGNIDIGSHELSIDRFPRIEETIPITQWYAWDSPSGSPARKIQSTWFENRDVFTDSTRPLPSGWSRKKVDLEKLGISPRLYPYSDAYDKYLYQHQDLNSSWFFPFPVPDAQVSIHLVMPDQPSFLFSKTKVTHAYAMRLSDTYYRTSIHNTVDLFNASKEGIGQLHAHNREQVEYFPTDKTDESPRRIELVAISRSRVYGRVYDIHKHFWRPDYFSERYNVLWVEWKDGVAYRLASGYVEKAAWEKLDLKDVDLVLG
jgi:hypothetical protein